MCRVTIGRKSCGIHEACRDQNCSVATIRKLIDEAGVESLEKKDVYGRVPLFYAIRKRCSLPVMQTLIDANPNAILQPDFCGDLPLYMLFRPQIDPRVLEHALNKNPSLVLFREKKFSGAQSLLQTLCAQWVGVINKLKTKSNSNNDVRENVLIHSKVRSDRTLLDRWTKLVLTARAAHRITHTTTNTKPKTDIPELHFALQLECLPPAILCQFIEMYPEQAATKIGDLLQTNGGVGIDIDIDSADSICIESDANSMTSRTSCSESMSNVYPLHYFLSKYPITTRISKTKMSSAADRVMPIHKLGTILNGLVRAFPKAASIQHGHNLPLHMAIANRSSFSWETGLQELFYANPSALFVKDKLGTNLVPFLQKATVTATEACHHDERVEDSSGTPTTANNSDKNINRDLNTVYCLLREDPSVLSRMIVLSSWS